MKVRNMVLNSKRFILQWHIFWKFVVEILSNIWNWMIHYASITSSLITPECFYIRFLNTLNTISRNRNTIWSLNNVLFTGSQNNKATKFYYNTYFLITVLLKLNSNCTSNHQVYVIYSYNYLHTHNQYIVPLGQSIALLDLSV